MSDTVVEKTEVEIARGDQRVAVVALGGCLRSYEVAGRALLDGFPLGEQPARGRGQVLAPWPNRLENGSYEFDGKRLQLPLNEPENGNAIHGLVRAATWNVVDFATDRAVLAYVLEPQPGYPFPLALRLEYALSEAGLTVTTTARNIGTERCPYGCGQHPYFTLGTPTIDGLRLRIPAAVVAYSGDRGLPSGSGRVDGTDYDFREGRAIGETVLDNAYSELERDSDGRARVLLDDPSDSSRITVWVDETYPYLMVFSGDPYPDLARRSVAVEPMTCPPNAFRTGESLIRLEPGQSISSTWGIEPRFTAAGGSDAD